MERIHVLFVREKDQQMSGSGCCGKLEGDVIELSKSSGELLFCENRSIMEHMGEIYRRLDKEFGSQVELEVIDPRNIVFLTITLLRQWRKTQYPLRERIRQFIKGFRVSSVFVNGQLAAVERYPEYEAVVKKVRSFMHPNGRE